jgi:hypothetical protein
MTDVFSQSTHIVRSVGALALVVVITAAAPSGCSRNRVVRATVTEKYRAVSKTVAFIPGGTKPTSEAGATLELIARRARAGVAFPILIIGLANEGGALGENLDLAERRAGVVADELVARGLSRHHLVLAGVEAPPEDPAGARSELQFVEAITSRSRPPELGPITAALRDEPTEESAVDPSR